MIAYLAPRGESILNTTLNACICLVLLCRASISLGQGTGAPPISVIGAESPSWAIPGQPFGVLATEFRLPDGWGSRTPRVILEDRDGRIFYPVISVRTIEVTEVQEPLEPLRIGRRGGLIDRVRSAIRPAAEKKEVPVAIRVQALFRGDQPITVQLAGDLQRQISLPVSQQPTSYSLDEGLRSWWHDYTQHASQEVAGDDSPKLVHTYLTTMLADRLGLPRVDLDPPENDQKQDSQPLKTLALLAAIEPLREAILEEVITQPGKLSRMELPVPSEPAWEPAVTPAAGQHVRIEPLAMRVPPECFYLRFGSFTNYVWFQEIAERFGGDITQAVLLRGFNHDASARMERMLAAKMTTVAKMFGDKLISDLAIVGSDLYMKEGASLGVLFQASNVGLLRSAIESDRKAVVSNNPDASLQSLTIGGRTVSLLNTPDNRIRSFFLIDGDHVLVTTSETLLKRFIEVSDGAPSLGQNDSFRWARTWMPETNQYSVFGYFSPEFFHRLVSPQYQIELRRRLEAVAHLEVAEVASQAALAEGVAADNLDAMLGAGLIPSWFDVRADGSRVLRSGDRWIDSLRGGRGSFLPIADVQLSHVTEEESQSYQRVADFYQREWRHMDPLLVGLRRFQNPQGPGEQVAFEAYIAPFEAEKYGWIAKQLAEPSPVEIKLPADDAASVQLHVRGTTAADDYYLFGGVKDMLPPEPEDVKGLIKTLQALRAAPAYIGAWPKPGLIEQLPLGIGLVRPDYAGFSRMLGGLWRWQDDQLSLLSFNRGILDQAIPQIAVERSDDLAQARLRVANLQNSQIAVWVNNKWWERGWRSSYGNAHLLDTIHEQLKVPSQNCLSTAERLLDVRLQCPLGGEYRFYELQGSATGWWQSSAWESGTWSDGGKPVPPNDYSAPWIEWFRGGRVHVTQRPDSIAAVGLIELEMPPLRVETTPMAPDLLPTLDFDLFELPFKLFGESKTNEAASERKSF